VLGSVADNRDNDDADESLVMPNVARMLSVGP
jgi:hypothetical protein